MSDFEKVKQAVENAKQQYHQLQGQKQAKESTLEQYGFSGDNIVDQVNDYLDKKEKQLDKQEPELEKEKQSIVSEYNKIIKQTAS